MLDEDGIIYPFSACITERCSLNLLANLLLIMSSHTFTYCIVFKIVAS